MTPYYETALGKLYHGDCLEIMPELGPVDLVLTDPPYPDYEKYPWTYVDLVNLFPDCRAFVFWKGDVFPLEYTARHIWSKANRNVGSRGEQYEEIYELNGNSTGLVLRHAVIDSKMNAQINSDIYFDHPTQKPIRLIRRLLEGASCETVLDPFIGSGTTAIACERLHIKWIGIEISEEYAEMAAKRIERETSQLKLF